MFILLSANNDKTIKIWDLQTEALFKTLKGHKDRVYTHIHMSYWKYLLDNNCLAILILILFNSKNINNNNRINIT